MIHQVVLNNHVYKGELMDSTGRFVRYSLPRKGPGITIRRDRANGSEGVHH